MTKQFSLLLLFLIASCSRTEPTVAQAPSATGTQITPPAPEPALESDKFGLELVSISSSEDFSSTDTTVNTVRNGSGVTHSVGHVDGCGYYPASPKYHLAGDTLELSYILKTDMDALPAGPCRYTSEFRFKEDPGGNKVVFSVRPE